MMFRKMRCPHQNSHLHVYLLYWCSFELALSFSLLFIWADYQTQHILWIYLHMYIYMYAYTDVHCMMIKIKHHYCTLLLLLNTNFVFGVEFVSWVIFNSTCILCKTWFDFKTSFVHWVLLKDFGYFEKYYRFILFTSTYQI